MVNLHEEIRKNKQKSLLIIFLFFVLIFLISTSFGLIMNINENKNIFDLGNIIISTSIGSIITIIYLLFFMNSGSKMILKTTGAIPASREKYPFLFHTVEALSIAAGMKTTPKCYIIEDSALNAYATGFKEEDSYIVVTTGLIKKLNREELEGVLGHEMSHIKNHDIKVMLLAAGLVGVIILMADIMFRIFLYSPKSSSNKKNGGLTILIFIIWLFLIILSPIIGKMIQMAISRQREYLADANGALLTRYPEGLASALEKIKNDPDPLVDHANKATAHLFISTPFRNRNSFLNRLFSTHPPLEERIKRLRNRY